MKEWTYEATIVTNLIVLIRTNYSRHRMNYATPLNVLLCDV